MVVLGRPELPPPKLSAAYAAPLGLRPVRSLAPMATGSEGPAGFPGTAGSVSLRVKRGSKGRAVDCHSQGRAPGREPPGLLFSWARGCSHRAPPQSRPHSASRAAPLARPGLGCIVAVVGPNRGCPGAWRRAGLSLTGRQCRPAARPLYSPGALTTHAKGRENPRSPWCRF